MITAQLLTTVQTGLKGFTSHGRKPSHQMEETKSELGH